MNNVNDMQCNHLNSSEEKSGQHRNDCKMVLTRGVLSLADQFHCYWLIEEIAFGILPVLLKKYLDWFYKIEFQVYPNKTAIISIDNGNGRVLLQRKIERTDFPMRRNPVQFFLCESENCYCLMLPEEY